MLATFQVGSGALAALIAILIAIIILAVIVARMMKRDQLIRIARIGVFIQRERLHSPEADVYLFDPLAEDSESRPAPIPPPTPPPPLPPDETQTWPQREEGL